MRKIFMTLAAAVFILASCSETEMTESNSQSPDAIKLSVNTTRAGISTIDALQNATGFTVFGTTSGVTGAWYANVAGNNYGYSSGAWGWVGTAAQWPTTATDYPMTFYAYHPATGTGGLTVSNTAATTISGAVVIPAAAADQKDLLAAKAIANAKPTGGILPMTFEHITSKINFGIIAGDDTDVNVQFLGINTFKNSATYNYIGESWGTASGSTNYDYWNSTTSPKATFVPATKDETTANPIYTGTHSNHLMLIPQTTTAWAPATNPTPLASESYIQVIYRLSNAGGEIGYGDATDYLDNNEGYVDGTHTWGTPAYTGIEEGANAYGAKPFYIRVGFPVAANWAKGKGYTYNLCLGTSGSTNGYYLDDTYYDEDGIDTGIPIKKPDGTPVEPGDPVTDGTINFLLNVTNWDDQTPIDIED